VYDAKLDAWEAVAERAREEGRPIPALSHAPPGAFFLTGVAILIGSLLYQALFILVGPAPVYVWLGGAVCIGLLGGAYCALREIRKWRSLAVLQIVLACVGGMGTVFGGGHAPSTSTELIVAVLGAAGAVVTAANGFDKLLKLLKSSTSAQ
jgi:hypothetical protein